MKFLEAINRNIIFLLIIGRKSSMKRGYPQDPMVDCYQTANKSLGINPILIMGLIIITLIHSLTITHMEKEVSIPITLGRLMDITIFHLNKILVWDLQITPMYMIQHGDLPLGDQVPPIAPIHRAPQEGPPRGFFPALILPERNGKLNHQDP